MVKQKQNYIFSVTAILLLFTGAAIFSKVAMAENHSLQGSLKIFKKGGKKTLRNFDNAVVYLEGISTPAPAEPIGIDQRKKKFQPRIRPVIKGQVVRFYNMDRVEHNVFSTEEKNTFDLGRYPKKEYRDQPYNDLGLYKVYCNIHKKMILDILVVPNRYFAVTDKKGKYHITDVPAGEYVLKAWHIYGGSVELPRSVKQDTNLPELSLNSTRVVRELEAHLNKEGNKYRAKSRGFYK
ncbi:MAG: hypothetical protein KAJ95_04825 [Gammaproteobacteria bacterium]|nr:hypothetical protein [Gammaproteobacteria bacterium]